MYGKNFKISDRTWLVSSWIGAAVLYLNLIWKTTGDIDRLTIDSLFWSAILWLLWRKRSCVQDNSSTVSSFIGLTLLGSILAKTTTLFWFESTLLPLFPIAIAIALTLIASGFKGLSRYSGELFFAWFLFFPEGVIGRFIDSIVQITILNAKFSTYLLYYLGFDVASYGNWVLLSLPELGQFKAIVDYPCAGVPMILLMLKLALLLISFAPLSKSERLVVPLFAIGLGFLLGVVRVCILTLLIPNPAKFDYWHGAQGSQIFSTLAILFFSGFCYWVVEREQVGANRCSPVE